MIYRGPSLSRSYDSAPRPPPLPSSSPVSKLSLFLSLPLCRHTHLAWTSFMKKHYDLFSAVKFLQFLLIKILERDLDPHLKQMVIQNTA
jgi:hypothetical protein